ncbi:MAG: ABC transporter ATP-binding protein [Gaiellaceae bacterium]
MAELRLLSAQLGAGLLSARHVSRRFGGLVALEPCNLELGAGETVALVGANGAGKTTLLSILAGALDPSTGAVERPVAVGWAPQRPALYGKLTPRENLELFAALAGAPVAATDLPERPAVELSVGQRQRLNLALALLGSPPVLLLDEPTASLDAERREELWRLLAEVVADGGAVCFVTQNLEEVERADRVGLIENGRLSFG